LVCCNTRHILRELFVQQTLFSFNWMRSHSSRSSIKTAFYVRPSVRGQQLGGSSRNIILESVKTILYPVYFSITSKHSTTTLHGDPIHVTSIIFRILACCARKQFLLLFWIRKQIRTTQLISVFFTLYVPQRNVCYAR
jgi:hypothetical protein